jgi:hypothetical protein
MPAEEGLLIIFFLNTALGELLNVTRKHDQCTFCHCSFASLGLLLIYEESEGRSPGIDIVQIDVRPKSIILFRSTDISVLAKTLDCENGHTIHRSCRIVQWRPPHWLLGAYCCVHRVRGADPYSTRFAFVVLSAQSRSLHFRLLRD